MRQRAKRKLNHELNSRYFNRTLCIMHGVVRPKTITLEKEGKQFVYYDRYARDKETCFSFTSDNSS